MSESKKSREFPRITIDSIIDLEDSIVLIKRLNPPYKDQWAVPGGFIELGERVEDAVIRETKEETGLTVKIDRIFRVYSDPERDPRGHTITLVYVCKNLSPIETSLKAQTDAKEVRIFKKNEILGLKLAFDHSKIIFDYLNRTK
jgi:8-oxo-dGTP diphosphatase